MSFRQGTSCARRARILSALAYARGRPILLPRFRAACMPAGAPVFDQLPLKPGHGAHDVHHQTSGWSAEVEVVTQGYEGHPVGAQVLDRRDQVLEAAPQPV